MALNALQISAVLLATTAIAAAGLSAMHFGFQSVLLAAAALYALAAMQWRS